MWSCKLKKNYSNVYFKKQKTKIYVFKNWKWTLFFLITYYNYKLKQNPFFIVPSLTNYLGWYYLRNTTIFILIIKFYFFIILSLQVTWYCFMSWDLFRFVYSHICDVSSIKLKINITKYNFMLYFKTRLEEHGLILTKKKRKKTFSILIVQKA
jgi:hypothetical protein